jgi:hypothetical protein
MIERDNGLTECPHCKSPYEIAAVKLSVMQPTSMVLVCKSCGLAHVEAPPASGKLPISALRIAISLVVAAPAVLYMVMWLLAFERPPPVQTGKLATTIEQSGNHIEQFETLHPL